MFSGSRVRIIPPFFLFCFLLLILHDLTPYTYKKQTKNKKSNVGKSSENELELEREFSHGSGRWRGSFFINKLCVSSLKLILTVWKLSLVSIKSNSCQVLNDTWLISNLAIIPKPNPTRRFNGHISTCTLVLLFVNIDRIPTNHSFSGLAPVRQLKSSLFKWIQSAMRSVFKHWVPIKRKRTVRVPISPPAFVSLFAWKNILSERRHDPLWGIKSIAC